MQTNLTKIILRILCFYLQIINMYVFIYTLSSKALENSDEEIVHCQSKIIRIVKCIIKKLH